MSPRVDDFDMNAAWARRAQGDLPAFMTALAARLELALPQRVEVERRKDGLFSRASHVHAITVNGQTTQFRLVYHRGVLTATKAKSVRGVVIGTEDLPVPQWLTDLRTEVNALAAHLGGASDVLHDFL